MRLRSTATAGDNRELGNECHGAVWDGYPPLSGTGRAADKAGKSAHATPGAGGRGARSTRLCPGAPWHNYQPGSRRARGFRPLGRGGNVFDRWLVHRPRPGQRVSPAADSGIRVRLACQGEASDLGQLVHADQRGFRSRVGVDGPTDRPQPVALASVFRRVRGRGYGVRRAGSALSPDQSLCGVLRARSPAGGTLVFASGRPDLFPHGTAGHTATERHAPDGATAECQPDSFPRPVVRKRGARQYRKCGM